MLLVAFGGGTNSTGKLLGMYERGIAPDLTLFSDTGGERDDVYRHVDFMSEWCIKHGFPEITRVGLEKSLESDCLNRNALPSIAYGFKSCSQRWKLEPQDKFCNNHEPCKEVWARGEQITKYIGYDAGEAYRAKDYSDKKYIVEYPLIEWDWTRDDCVEAIDRHGIPRPGKSACFFCPSSRPSEVKWLQRTHPDLYMRAVEMERNADLTSVKGLGRNWSWEELGKQEDLFCVPVIDAPCGCFDGD